MQLTFLNRWAVVVFAFVMQSVGLAMQSTGGAPPIEVVVAECAEAELNEYNDATCGDACGTEGACAKCSGQCSSNCCGPDVCCPTMEEFTEEKSCWNVKCEKVCVPAIRMPWQPGGSRLTLFSWLHESKKCPCGECIDDAEATATCDCEYSGHRCAPKCGAARCVSVLESKSYEVTSCRCKWEIRRLPCCDGASDCGESIQDDSPEADESSEAILPMPTP